MWRKMHLMQREKHWLVFEIPFFESRNGLQPEALASATGWYFWALVL